LYKDYWEINVNGT
jgi:hypothetical protein